MTVYRHPLEVDPLIAEAKQRAHRRRLLVSGLALVVASAIAVPLVVESGRPAGTTRSGVAPLGPRAAVGSFGRSDFTGGRLMWATNNRSRVWFTTNAGRSWRLTQLPGLRGGTFIGADFIDPAHGWGVSDLNNRVEVARTTDGGRTWRASYLRGGSAWGFHFRTPTRGYVVLAEPRGDGYVTKRYATRDGGATWTRVPPPESKLLRSSHAVKLVSSGPEPGGPSLTLVRTDDHGRDWTPVSLPGNPEIKEFKSFGHLRVVLGYSQRSYTRLAVYVSEDAGRHWTLRMAPRGVNPGGPADACCFNVSAPVAGTWFALANTLYVTHDEGRTWHSVPASWPHYRGGIDFAPIDFVDARVGWFLGGTTLLRTTDGGRHWAPSGPRLPKARTHR